MVSRQQFQLCVVDLHKVLHILCANTFAIPSFCIHGTPHIICLLPVHLLGVGTTILVLIHSQGRKL